MKPSDERSLLRWYPADWRERYGPELLAMIEDRLGGEAPSFRLRAELWLAGIKERMRRRGLTGRDLPAADRCRAGVILILTGWSAAVVAGAMFAKTTEHWRDRTAPAGRAGADAAYLALEIAAAVGAAAVAAGVVAALPALRRALSAGGRRPIWNAVRLPGALTVVTASAGAGLGFWARHLTSLQRNGGSGGYTAAFLACGVLVVATIASWTRAGIRVERHLRPSRRALRAEWVAATLTGTAALTVTAGMISWWAAVAARSPWVLHGSTPGSHPSWWALDLGLATLVALAGSAASLAGGQRLASAARAGLWRG